MDDNNQDMQKASFPGTRDASSNVRSFASTPESLPEEYPTSEGEEEEEEEWTPQDANSNFWLGGPARLSPFPLSNAEEARITPQTGDSDAPARFASRTDNNESRKRLRVGCLDDNYRRRRRRPNEENGGKSRTNIMDDIDGFVRPKPRRNYGPSRRKKSKEEKKTRLPKQPLDARNLFFREEYQKKVPTSGGFKEEGIVSEASDISCDSEDNDECSLSPLVYDDSAENMEQDEKRNESGDRRPTEEEFHREVEKKWKALSPEQLTYYERMASQEAEQYRSKLRGYVSSPSERRSWEGGAGNSWQHSCPQRPSPRHMDANLYEQRPGPNTHWGGGPVPPKCPNYNQHCHPSMHYYGPRQPCPYPPYPPYPGNFGRGQYEEQNSAPPPHFHPTFNPPRHPMPCAPREAFPSPPPHGSSYNPGYPQSKERDQDQGGPRCVYPGHVQCGPPHPSHGPPPPLPGGYPAMSQCAPLPSPSSGYHTADPFCPKVVYPSGKGGNESPIKLPPPRVIVSKDKNGVPKKYHLMYAAITMPVERAHQVASSMFAGMQDAVPAQAGSSGCAGGRMPPGGNSFSCLPPPPPPPPPPHPSWCRERYNGGSR